MCCCCLFPLSYFVRFRFFSDELDEYTKKIKKLEAEISQMKSEGEQQMALPLDEDLVKQQMALPLNEELVKQNEQLKEQHLVDTKEMHRLRNFADKLYEEMNSASDRLKGIIDEQQGE